MQLLRVLTSHLRRLYHMHASFDQGVIRDSGHDALRSDLSKVTTYILIHEFGEGQRESLQLRSTRCQHYKGGGGGRGRGTGTHS